MYSKIELGLKYADYWLKASNGKGHGIHSPFVFDFVTKVLNDHRSFYAYEQLEALRHSLKQNDTLLEINDFGAGSRIIKNNFRKVSSIAQSSLKPKKFAQLLFRMVNFYKPALILELGTSLGVTTGYLAAAKNDAQVITMEGATAVAAVAKTNFEQLQLQNIKLVTGNFDETLPLVLQKSGAIDFAFLDGNHRYQPTIQYFKQVLQKSHDHTIIILDDIHWSEEMEQAWTEVRQHPSVTATIDLFFIGIVLLRNDFKAKQHFKIRF